MLTGNYQVLYDLLKGQISKKRLSHDPLHTLAFGTDASFYRMVPKLVIKAKDENEVALILKEVKKLMCLSSFISKICSSLYYSAKYFTFFIGVIPIFDVLYIRQL